MTAVSLLRPVGPPSGKSTPRPAASCPIGPRCGACGSIRGPPHRQARTDPGSGAWGLSAICPARAAPGARPPSPQEGESLTRCAGARRTRAKINAVPVAVPLRAKPPPGPRGDSPGVAPRVIRAGGPRGAARPPCWLAVSRPAPAPEVQHVEQAPGAQRAAATPSRCPWRVAGSNPRRSRPPFGGAQRSERG
jgi:hypothetical protein